MMMALAMKPTGGGSTPVEATTSEMHRNPQAEKMRVLMDFGANMIARRDFTGSAENTGRIETPGLMMQQIAKHWGEDSARKLVTQISLFNQDPAYKKLSPEDRIRAFSMKKTGDPQLDEMLASMRSGYGADHHFLQDSAMKDNAVMSGRVPADNPDQALSTGAIQALMTNDKFKALQSQLQSR